MCIVSAASGLNRSVGCWMFIIFIMVVLLGRTKVELGRNVKEACLGCYLVVQSSRSGYGPPSRALFDLGMVPVAVFFKGTVTCSSFGTIFWFLPGRTNVELGRNVKEA